MNNIYRMSSAGRCPRALSAEKLGYKPEPAPLWLQRTADEGKWHEERLVNQLIEEGYEVYYRQIELAIKKDNYQIVGHIDGIASKDGQKYLLEIKSMSQYEFDRWMRARFLEFLSYADQITCYMEASGLKKALYLVKNRSSGYIDRDILNGTPSDPSIIYSKLSAVTVSVAKKELYPAEFSPSELECRRCFFRNVICIPDKKELSKATETELLNAVYLVKQGNALIEEGKELFDAGKSTLGGYLTITNPDTKSNFRIGGATVSRFKVPAYGDAVSYPRKDL